MIVAGKTMEEWTEFSRRDDCLERMVPSDLRQLISTIIKITDQYNASVDYYSEQENKRQWEYEHSTIASYDRQDL